MGTSTRVDSWHDKEERFLENIERQCGIYYDHHMRDYHYYDTLSARFNIPILVISSVNALTAICLNNFLKQEIVSILNAVLSAGVGVVGSIQLYMRLNEKMTKSLRSSISFKRLALKISKELSVDRAQRVTEGQSFLAECFAELNTTIEQGNPVERTLPNHLALEKVLRSPTSPLQRVADRLLEFSRQSVDGDGGRSDANSV
jgi:hypothetical protein